MSAATPRDTLSLCHPRRGTKDNEGSTQNEYSHPTSLTLSLCLPEGELKITKAAISFGNGYGHCYGYSFWLAPQNAKAPPSWGLANINKQTRLVN